MGTVPISLHERSAIQRVAHVALRRQREPLARYRWPAHVAAQPLDLLSKNHFALRDDLHLVVLPSVYSPRLRRSRPRAMRSRTLRQRAGRALAAAAAAASAVRTLSVRCAAPSPPDT